MSIEKDFLDAKIAYLQAKKQLFREKMMSDMDETNLLVSQVLDIFDFAVTEYSAKKNPKIFMIMWENGSVEFLLEDNHLGSLKVDNWISRYARPEDLKKSMNVDLSLALERARRKNMSKEEVNQFLELISEYCEVDKNNSFLGWYFIQLK